MHSPVELNHITIKGKHGDSEAPFVVVHGMLGNCNNWRSPARMLADATGRDVHCLDLRNHGASPHHHMMSLQSLSNDIAHFIEDKLPQDDAVLVGHSLGGKATMQLALRRPELVKSHVVADISPVDYNLSGKGMKAISFSLDFIKFLKDMPSEVMQDLSAADKYLLERGVDQIGVRQFLLTNIRRNAAEKTAEMKPNLDALQAHIENGVLVGFETDHHTSSDSPALIITGELSPYVKMERDAPIFNSYFPNNTHISLENTGHWVHAQRPKEFVSSIVEWMDEK